MGRFLNIIEKTGFMNYFAVVLKPLLRFIYGPIIEKDHVYDELSSNMIANLLGLGTLATLSGIKAFQRLYTFSPYPKKTIKRNADTCYIQYSRTLFISIITHHVKKTVWKCYTLCILSIYVRDISDYYYCRFDYSKGYRSWIELLFYF